MSLLSRHLLRSLAPPFVWGVMALTGLLLMNSLAGLIDKLGGKGLPVGLMVEAIALAIPALMVLTLPMAVLTATLYAYGQLAADTELVAMYANGISVWRMARPALIAAAAIALVNFILFDQFVPRSNARYKALLNDVAAKYPTLAFEPRRLNVIANTPYILYFEEMDSVRLHRVTIIDLGAIQGQRVIHADSGSMSNAPNGTDMMMLLHDGEIIEYPPSQQGRMQSTTFKADLLRLRDVTNKLTLSGEQTRERGDRERSGCELLDGIVDQEWFVKEGTSQRALMTSRDLRRLTGLAPVPPPGVMLKPKTPPHCGIYRKGEQWLERQLLSPAALKQKLQDSAQEESNERVRLKMQADAAARDQATTVKSDSANASALISTTDTLQRNPALAGLPGQFADSLPARMAAMAQPPPSHEITTTWSEMNGSRNGVKYARLRAAAFETEFHKKIAIPLSSFCFVLLGLALALRNPRGGIGLVIGGSLVIFMVFYILIIGGENLAKKLYIDPVAAIHGPLIGFTLLGLLAVIGANREMGSARSSSVFGQISDWFHRLRNRST